MTPANDCPIGDEEKRTFDAVGGVCIRGLISAKWRQLLESDFENIKASSEDFSNVYADDPKLAAQVNGKTLVRQQVWRVSEAMRKFVFESPIAHAAATLLRSSEVKLYEDLMIFKSAGAEQPTPWHQDDPQWPVSGHQTCSVWFCLDPVTNSTGALRFAAGSHRGPAYRPYLPAARSADLDADSRFFDGGAFPDVDADPTRFPVICYDTQPGDVVIFHPRTVHSATGSAPSYPRRTFSIRFLGDDMRWQPKKSVAYVWLAHVNLKAGDRIVGESFPVVWPTRS